MYISACSIDEYNEYTMLWKMEVESIDGLISLESSHLNIFKLLDIEYEITMIFQEATQNGHLLLKKEGKPFIRTLVSIAPTFLLTMNVSNGVWLEINVSSDKS